MQVVTIETVLLEINILVSSTGNFKIIALDRMNKLKNNAFVGNTGHFDNEINLVGSEGLEGHENRRLHTPQKYVSSSLSATV